MLEVMIGATSGGRDVPRRRILFLGGRSFELEEEGEDPIGRRRLAIVERGQGLRRSIVLCGYEVGWCCQKLRRASREPGHLAYLGRLIGGRRSLAVWIRGEEDGKSSFQMVATTAGRREQIFAPKSDFGGGWEGVALVMEGFGFGDGWARTTNGQPKLEAVGRLRGRLRQYIGLRMWGMWWFRKVLKRGGFGSWIER